MRTCFRRRTTVLASSISPRSMRSSILLWLKKTNSPCPNSGVTALSTCPVSTPTNRRERPSITPPSGVIAARSIPVCCHRKTRLFEQFACRDISRVLPGSACPLIASKDHFPNGCRNTRMSPTLPSRTGSTATPAIESAGISEQHSSTEVLRSHSCQRCGLHKQNSPYSQRPVAAREWGSRHHLTARTQLRSCSVTDQTLP